MRGKKQLKRLSNLRYIVEVYVDSWSNSSSIVVLKDRYKPWLAWVRKRQVCYTLSLPCVGPLCSFFFHFSGSSECETLHRYSSWDSRGDTNRGVESVTCAPSVSQVGVLWVRSQQQLVHHVRLWRRCQTCIPLPAWRGMPSSRNGSSSDGRDKEDFLLVEWPPPLCFWGWDVQVFSERGGGLEFSTRKEEVLRKRKVF